MSKNQPQKDKQVQARPGTSKVSVVVFLATLAVVLISLISVLFPALLVRSTSGFEDKGINSYEPGVWAGPVVAINLILLGIGVLYFKNKLPKILSDSIRFVFNFEVSKRVATITILAMLGIYVGFTVSELTSEETWADYKTTGSSLSQGVKDRVAGWTLDDVRNSPAEPHLRYMLLSFSLKILGNIRIIPLVVSIALAVLTYFITKELSQKRFAGLVGTAILLQSSVFLSYDTSATYDNLWTLLYILSLYLIYKKWPLSPLSFIASIPAKALTALFLPMTLFFIYRSNLPRQKKIILLTIYGAIIVAVIVAALSGIGIQETQASHDANDFWRGFTAWAFQMRFDVIVLVFILPLIVGLFILSRRGVAHADSIMVLILGILLSAPILQGFTNQTVQPYRFVPLVVFFAMGVGMILTKRPSEQP